MKTFFFIQIPKLSLLWQQNVFFKKSPRLLLYYISTGIKSSKKNKVIFRKTPYFWIFRRKGFYFTKRRMLKMNKYLLEKSDNLFKEHLFNLKLKSPMWPLLKFFKNVFRKIKKTPNKNFKKILNYIWFRKKWSKISFKKLWVYSIEFYTWFTHHLEIKLTYEFKKPLGEQTSNHLKIKKKFTVIVSKDDDTFIHELDIQKLRIFYLKFYLYKVFALMAHNYWLDYSYDNFLKNQTTFYQSIKGIILNDIYVKDLKNYLTDFFKKYVVVVFKKDKHLRKINRKAALKLKTEKLKTVFKRKKIFLKNFFEKFTPRVEEVTPYLGFPSIYNNFNKNYSLNYVHLLLEDLGENMLLFFSLIGDCGVNNQTSSRNSLSFFKKNWVNSNYYIPLGLAETIKKLIFIKKKVFKKDFSHRYYQFYLNNFLNKFIAVKTLCIIETNHTKFKSFFTNGFIIATSELVSYFSKWNKRFFKQFQVSHLIEFMLFSFFKKDLYFFTKFFQRSLENIFLKKHKKILYSMEFILKKFFTKIFFFTKILGFKFEISGKISVTGNSKARNKIIRHGFYSLTNKNLKLDYLYGIVRTSTGVLGFRSFITY